MKRCALHPPPLFPSFPLHFFSIFPAFPPHFPAFPSFSLSFASEARPAMSLICCSVSSQSFFETPVMLSILIQSIGHAVSDRSDACLLGRILNHVCKHAPLPPNSDLRTDVIESGRRALCVCYSHLHAALEGGVDLCLKGLVVSFSDFSCGCDPPQSL